VRIEVSVREYDAWKQQAPNSWHFRYFGPIEPYEEASRKQAIKEASEWLNPSPEHKANFIAKIRGWDHWFGWNTDRSDEYYEDYYNKTRQENIERHKILTSEEI